jgi:hypothetical protein
MGAYLFFIVCTGIWGAFGWALGARPLVLDRTWGRGEERDPDDRLGQQRETANIVFWSSTTFGGGAS